jgi:hypothetical protein
MDAIEEQIKLRESTNARVIVEQRHGSLRSFWQLCSQRCVHSQKFHLASILLATSYHEGASSHRPYWRSTLILRLTHASKQTSKFSLVFFPLAPEQQEAWLTESGISLHTASSVNPLTVKLPYSLAQERGTRRLFPSSCSHMTGSGMTKSCQQMRPWYRHVPLVALAWGRQADTDSLRSGQFAIVRHSRRNFPRSCPLGARFVLSPTSSHEPFCELKV